MYYKNLGIIILALFSAPLVITLLSVPITSVSNMMMLNGMGMDASSKLIDMILHDYINFGPFVLLIAAVASTLAIINAKFISYFVSISPFLLYGMAVAAGLALALVGIVELTFKTQLIAGNRSIIGFLFHLVAGFSGGLVYVYISSFTTVSANIK